MADDSSYLIPEDASERTLHWIGVASDGRPVPVERVENDGVVITSWPRTCLVDPPWWAFWRKPRMAPGRQYVLTSSDRTGLDEDEHVIPDVFWVADER